MSPPTNLAFVGDAYRIDGFGVPTVVWLTPDQVEALHKHHLRQLLDAAATGDRRREAHERAWEEAIRRAVASKREWRAA